MALLLTYKSQSIILINVYMPPSSRKDFAVKKWNSLEAYMTSLINDYPRTSIILLGDFNARLGVDNALLEDGFKDKFSDSDDPDFNMYLSRFIKDKTANFSGYCMAKLIYRW